MQDNAMNFIGLNHDPAPIKGLQVYPDRNYHTNARLIERFLVDTIEESLASIDRCIERNNLLKLKGTDD